MDPLDWRGPVPYKKGINVVMNLMAPASRRIAQIAAVGAVALVLTTAVSVPAEARRREAERAANHAIDVCFVNGGNPDAYLSGGTIHVSCVWEDGSVSMLDFTDD